MSSRDKQLPYHLLASNVLKLAKASNTPNARLSIEIKDIDASNNKIGPQKLYSSSESKLEDVYTDKNRDVSSSPAKSPTKKDLLRTYQKRWKVCNEYLSASIPHVA